MPVAELAEEVGGPVGPVQLVEVDVVGLQAPEAVVQRLEQVLAREVQATCADMRGPGGTARRAGGLGGQHDVVAPAGLLQPAADVLFGAALGLGARRHGVHLSRIDQVDASVQGKVKLGMGLGFGVLFAPGHGAQGYGADLEVGAAKLAVVQERSDQKGMWVRSPRLEAPGVQPSCQARHAARMSAVGPQPLVATLVGGQPCSPDQLPSAVCRELTSPAGITARHARCAAMLGPADH